MSEEMFRLVACGLAAIYVVHACRHFQVSTEAQHRWLATLIRHGRRDAEREEKGFE